MRMRYKEKYRGDNKTLKGIEQAASHLYSCEQ